MGQFLQDLDLRWVGVVNGRVMWQTLQPLTYTTDDGDSITVPIGFLTDLATTPRAMWIWLPPNWKYTKAAVLHDYLLVSEERTWSEANKLFHEAMGGLGVNKTTNWVMYQSVCFWKWINRKILRR